MMQVVTIDPAQVGGAEYAEELCSRLEQGDILIADRTPFAPPEADAEFLRAQNQAATAAHKNIAYKPNRRRVTGASTASTEDADRLRRILATYSEGAIAYLGKLLPRYAAAWHVDYASYRPFEEQGRDLPLSRRNDLMHVDAFPTRPTHGGRILRMFTNVHPAKERVWATADPFADLVDRYAVAAGLASVTSPASGLRRSMRHIARAIGLRTPDHSAYDEFMLRFHNFLKANAEFQSAGIRDRTPFGPGVSWICFTDHIAHAVLSGQYAVEQTCIVPYSALLLPDVSPLAVLERKAGRHLAPRSPASGPPRGGTAQGAHA